MFIKFFLLFFWLLFSSLFCFSQNDSHKIESVFCNNRYYSVDAEQAKALYKNELLSNYVFLNGREYKIYHIGRETSPLFGSSIGLEGTIFVDGESYQDVILVYDIYKDKLVYITQAHIFSDCNFIELNRANVDSFYVEITKLPVPSTVSINKQYHFTKIDFPENINIAMQNGYYEVAYHGEIKLLVQHKATLVSNQGADAMQNGLYKYVHILNKFIFLDGNYYEVNKKRKFIKLFPDKRKSINKKLKSFAVRFDKINKEQLIEILQHINSI